MGRSERTNNESKAPKLLDCGCVTSRPRTSRLYGTRWRAYTTIGYILLKCLDCGKLIKYSLSRPDIQTSTYSPEKMIGNADREYEQ